MTTALDLPFSYGKNEIPLKQFQSININNFVRDRNPIRKKRPVPLNIEGKKVPSRNVKNLPKHLLGKVNIDKSKSKIKVKVINCFINPYLLIKFHSILL